MFTAVDYFGSVIIPRTHQLSQVALLISLEDLVKAALSNDRIEVGAIIRNHFNFESIVAGAAHVFPAVSEKKSRLVPGSRQPDFHGPPQPSASMKA